MKPYKQRAVVVALFLSTAFCSPGVAATFQGVGDLTGGEFYSIAYGVSAEGSVVVGSSRSDLGTEMFRWESGVMTGLGLGWAVSVSGDGEIVVGNYSGEAYRWTAQGGMQGLGGLYDNNDSAANAISTDGLVIVGSGSTGMINFPTEAFHWTTLQGMQGLGFLDTSESNWSYAYDVSVDGSVVVGYCHHRIPTVDEYDEAFIWTLSNGMTRIGMGKAYAVSDDGEVIIGISAGEIVFRWTDETGMVDLGYSGTVADISANGSIIVGSSFSPSGSRAYVWNAAHGHRHLHDVLENEFGVDITGWTLTSANGISADGTTIVGRGENPNGDEEGWIAFVPEFGVNHDECPNSVPLTLDSAYNGTSKYASGISTSDCSYNDVLDVWHSFTPTLNGDYTFSLTSSNFDPTLALYDSCGGALLACNDDTAQGVLPTKFDSQLTVPLWGDSTYYIRVAGYDGQAGDYTLTVTGENLTEPIADECVDAIPVFLSQPYNASTVTATGATVSSCSYNDIIDVWHSFTAELNGDYTISLCDSAFDTSLAVFDECGGVEIACNDDTQAGICSSKLQSQVTVSLAKGSTSYIRIAGYDGQTGDYTLTITGPDCTGPVEGDLNDDCKTDLRDFSILAAHWLECNIDPPESCW